MVDSLARVLAESEHSFIASESGIGIYRGEVAAGWVMLTWMSLAKAFGETKYWPIIRGGADDSDDLHDGDAATIVSAVPPGNIDEVLQPRFHERKESLSEMLPEMESDKSDYFNCDRAANMYELAALADASGINSFGGRLPAEWPSEPAHQGRVSLHTLRERKGKPSALLLVRVDNAHEVPAHLKFGGWNDCPHPELQVAVLREWGNEYRARPACITGDVVECVVINRPQTEAEAMKLAAQQWIFCDDIVGQGTQSVRKLAMEIWKSPTWFFWWD